MSCADTDVLVMVVSSHPSMCRHRVRPTTAAQVEQVVVADLPG